MTGMFVAANGQSAAPMSDPNSERACQPDAKPFCILSDTLGVDFVPYLKDHVVPTVRMNWYSRIPDKARPPIMERGKTILEFAIDKQGRVQSLKATTSSGYSDLDDAAWEAIRASSPLPPLPSQFAGQLLGLRMCFSYNSDLVPPVVIRSEVAKYTRNARKSKQQGTVTVSLIVNPKGKPTEVRVTRGLTPELDREAVKAVRKWKFQPARQNGLPVPALISEEVTFTLN